MKKMPSVPNKMQRYRRIDVTYEAVINKFNYTEQINKRFKAQFGLNKKVSFRANCLFLEQIVIFSVNFFRPAPSKMPSRTPMLLWQSKAFFFFFCQTHVFWVTLIFLSQTHVYTQ